MRMPLLIHKFGSPPHFYRMAGHCIPWLAALTAALFAAGLVGGLLLAPADYQQGESARIMYVHVPAALGSMGVYVFMAGCAAIGLVWRMKLADAMARAAAPIGASFTFLALFTGAVWGKPTWGTWWVWDARLTSELVLLFLYLGYMGLNNAIEDRRAAARASGILALVGVVNIPIIHYSVIWWNTLHQGPSISKFEAPSIHLSMLVPLLIMLAAYAAFFLLTLLVRTRCELLESEQRSRWVRELAAESGAPAAEQGAAGIATDGALGSHGGRS